MLELLTGGVPTPLSRGGIEVGFVGPEGTQVRTSLADAAQVRFEGGLAGAGVSLLQAAAVFPGQLVVLDGRPKTDKLDAVWLCKVAERQMLRPSFVPPEPIRKLRDLTRYRVDLVGERNREKNRVEKLLNGWGSGRPAVRAPPIAAGR